MDSATAVILVGALDFGRCPIATRLHRALWPLFDRPLLEYQLRLLARQGVKRAVVCVSDSADAVERAIDPTAFSGMDVRFVADRMPRGAAGSVKDAVAGRADGAVIVIKGGLAWVGDAPELLEAHRRGGGALTIFTSGEYRKDASDVRPAGIYVCEPYALEAVSASGYQDIKEQLIPALLKDGRLVKAMPLPGEVIGDRNYSTYIAIVEKALQSPEAFGINVERFMRFEDNVWIEPGCSISESARIFGPAAVLEGAVIEDGAVVAGPAVIGRRAVVARGAIVDDSVLWEDARVGDGAAVTGVVVGTGGSVTGGRRVVGRAIAGSRTGKEWQVEPLGERMNKARKHLGRRGDKAHATGGIDASWKPNSRAATQAAEMPQGRKMAYVVAGAAVLAAFLWSASSVIADLWRIWMTNDNYSSGVLVPFLAAYVIFVRRKELARTPIAPFYWGILVILAGFGMRLFGSMLVYASAERLSTVVIIVGVVLTLFGAKMTWRLGWVLLFLLLMLPWPNRVYGPVSLLLQNWATTSSVFLLEVLGIAVVQEGNILHMGQTSVAVAEACSGLRMLTAFMVISGLMAFLYNRSFWEKAVVVASSVPIAVLCNTMRLTATAIAFTAGYGEKTNEFFHGMGGYLMMPLALMMMAGELWMMKKLFVTVPADRPAGKAAAGVETEAQVGK